MNFPAIPILEENLHFNTWKTQTGVNRIEIDSCYKTLCINILNSAYHIKNRNHPNSGLSKRVFLIKMILMSTQEGDIRCIRVYACVCTFFGHLIRKKEATAEPCSRQVA